MTMPEVLIDEQELTEEVATGENGEIAVLLSWHLAAYIYPNKLGRVFDGRTTFEMKPNYPKKEPDVSFVAAERLPNRVRDIIKLAPDLAIEIVSPNDKQFEIEEKVLQYLALSVRLVWVISPMLQVIYVYHSGDKKPSILGIDDELDGEDVIPGFKLKISALFE